MIGKTILHYKVLEKLGEGGMGVVYKAQDTTLDRLVALKFLPHHISANEAEKARFLQEAKAASALNHPNVCTIYGIEEHEGQQYIEMEYVDGVTLREKFQKGPLLTKNAIAYAIQIGEALQEAHSKGIVHRDIKADNVMVNSKNQIKVMDFGLAKLKGSLKLTRTSSTVGTLAYMPPEQIQGGEVDTRSDIFAFGVLLFEMLTGKLPFRGEHEAAMMYSILNEEPESIQQYLPDVSSELAHVLSTALEKNSDDRYQSSGEMVKDLRRVQKQTSKISRTFVSSAQIPSVLPSSPSIQTPLPSRKKLWISIAAGGLVIIATVVVLFLRAPTNELNPKMTFRVLQIPMTQISFPGLSLDGKWAAFPAADANRKWDVYFMNTSGGEPRRITRDSSNYIQGADISPDGSQIAYDLIPEIHIVSSLGGVGNIVGGKGVIPRWRPDGKRVGYISYLSGPSKKLQFWSVQPDGSDNRLEFVDSVSVEGFICFSYSPDGQSVAWLKTFPEGRYQELFVHDLVIGNERQLTFDRKNITEVCWTPNNQIIFSSNRTGNTNLWMVSLSGGQPVQITKGSGPDLGMKISNDGRQLLYFQSQDIGHLWIAKSDGGNAHQITHDDRLLSRPSFSPDGTRIVFSLADPDPLQLVSEIHVADRDGSNKRRLTTAGQWAVAPQWSRDGKWIAYGSRPSLLSNRDSSKALLIEASNPGSMKLIGVGVPIGWASASEVITFDGVKSWINSVYTVAPKQFYEDSTRAVPILGGKYVFFEDRRISREGLWVVSAKELQKPKKILAPYPFALSSNGAFLLYVKRAGEVWRVALPDGKQQRLPGNFHGLENDFSISSDGTEIVYVEARSSGKLVMIESLFK